MGLAVGIIWTFYFTIVFILWLFILKFLKRKLYCSMLLMSLLLLPFWDVLIQKGIKTYIEIFKIEPVIYEYPIRDINNKIESLGLQRVKVLFSHNIEKNNKELFLQSKDILFIDILKNISNFVEIEKFGGYLNHKKLPNSLIRITLNKENYEIKKNINPKARYEIKTTKVEDKLFGFYKEQNFLLIDNKNNKILAKAKAFSFPKNAWHSYFRNYVIFRSLFTSKDKTFGKDGHYVLWIKGVDNIDLMIQKSLNIHIHTNKGIKED